MSVNSGKCSYSDKFLPLLKIKWEQFINSPTYETEFKTYLNNNFEISQSTIDSIISKFTGGSTLGASGTSSIETRKSVNTRGALSDIETSGFDSISSYYVANSLARAQMERDFKIEILGASVFSIDLVSGDVQFRDANLVVKHPNNLQLTYLNDRILEYKTKLMNQLLAAINNSNVEKEIIDAGISNEDLTTKIKTVLNRFEQFEKTGGTISQDAYTAYVILKNFDALLTKLTPFVKIASEFKDAEYDGVNKYVYSGPNVGHFSSWGGGKNAEFAKAEDQMSDLASLMLSVIPEIETIDGTDVVLENSFVGVSGFEAVMSALKKAILFSEIIDRDLADTYYQGLDINMEALLQAYIDAMSDSSMIKDSDASHVTFLVSKLKGILKYIYNEHTPIEIKNMFTQMFFKTEAVSYRTYAAKVGSGFEGFSLSGRITDNQIYFLTDLINGAANRFRKSPEVNSQFQEKYTITPDLSHNRLEISFPNNPNIRMTLTYDYKHNKYSNFKFNCYGTETNPTTIAELQKSLIFDVLSYVLPDTYETCIPQEGWSFMDDFAEPLGIVLLSRYADSHFRFKNNVLNLSSYLHDFAPIARRLSKIYGADTKSVIRSIEGNMLPVYQLTCLNYNVRSLVHDFSEYEPSFNAYAENYLVKHLNVLGEAQIRQQVSVGDRIKTPSDLTVRECAQLAILDDFYFPFTKEGKVYLQNATFADKNTHFLQEYLLNNDEELKNLVSKVLHARSMEEKEAAVGDFYEFIRQIRETKINTLLHTLIYDYEDVFGADVIYGPNSGTLSLKEKLYKLNTFVKSKKRDELVEAFAEKGLVCREEFYYSKSGGLNETLIHLGEVYKDPALFKKRIESQKKRFIETLNDTLDPVKISAYQDSRINNIQESYGAAFDEFFDPNTKTLSLVSKGKLHPIAEAYFLTDVLLSNEFNSITIGEIYSHPNKNKDAGTQWAPLNIVSVDKIWDGVTVINGQVPEGTHGVPTTRPRDWRIKMHFGNPFSYAGYKGTIKTETVKESVERFKSWLEGTSDQDVEPERRKWILQQIESGALDNKTLAYYTTKIPDNSYGEHVHYYNETTAPNHAHILRKMVIDSQKRRGVASLYKTDEYGRTEDYYAFSEASRLVAQIKRSVSYGATIHPFSQNSKKTYTLGDRKVVLNTGVETYVKSAVIDDFQAATWNYTGESKDDNDAWDGSGVELGIFSRFENNSLEDARVQDNKKTIMCYVDPITGSQILFKWAVYPLTNEVRRNSTNSVVSAEILTKKMMSEPITTVINLQQDFHDINKDIYYEDYKTHKHYKIVGIVEKDGKWVQQRRAVNETGSFIEEVTDGYSFDMNNYTVYDLDQIFGGAWSGNFDSGVFNFAEVNNDYLEILLALHGLKDNIIAYCVNKSAIKVGAGNINPNSSIMDPTKKLYWFDMSTKYGGIQMDADHELDEAEVTEMTQMISALIENGYCTNRVVELYSDIGEILTEKLKGFISEVTDPNKKLELYVRLANAMIESFEGDTKDTIGLAQAFISKAAASLREGNFDLKIPFSAATINGAFFSEVMSMINKKGIKHKYSGYAGVLNPSYGMIQFFRVHNPRTHSWEDRLFPQFAELCNELGVDVDTLRPSLNGEYTIPSDPKDKLFDLSLITKITELGEIRPEDTVVIVDKITRESKTYRINSWENYDEVKHWTDLSKKEIYKINYAPRDLSQGFTTITLEDPNFITVSPKGKTIQGKKISRCLEDLRSVRASFYLKKIQAAYKKTKTFDSSSRYYTFVEAVLRDYNLDDNLNINKIDSYLGSLEQITQRSAQLVDDIVNKKSTHTQEDTEEFIKNVAMSDLPTGFNPLSVVETIMTPHEVIGGRYQFDALGITDSEHIYQITSSDFFKGKLEAKYKPSTNLSEEYYDAVLFKNGKPIYIKIGELPEGAVIGDSQILKVNKVSSKNQDDVFFEGKSVLDSEGRRFLSYIVDGNSYEVIQVKDIEDLENLYRESFFDKIKRLNFTKQNYQQLIKLTNNKNADNATLAKLKKVEEARFKHDIEVLAEDQFESFNQYLYYIGARIPTQAMQSFMPMKLVAVTQYALNQIYVPRSQTWLQGSDYDIDKLYILIHSLNKTGIIDIGTDLQRYYPLNAVAKLNKPNGVQYQEAIEPDSVVISAMELEKVVYYNTSSYDVKKSTEREDRRIFVNVLNRILSSGTNNIIFNEKPEDMSDQEFLEAKARFLKILNTHSLTKERTKSSENALRNRVVQGALYVMRNILNQKSAGMPIAMDEQQDAAKKSTLGKAEKYLSSDNPLDKYMMQEQNMIGKKVIGITAVSLKTFFALTTYYNIKVEEIAKAISNASTVHERSAAVERITELCIPYGISNDNNTVIANLNLGPLTKVLNDSDKIGSYSAKDFIEILQKNSSRVDAALMISGLLSAATDNAKELILAKINATPELVDIYTYLLMSGLPFNEIAELMTSEEFNFATHFGTSTIFDGGTTALKVKKAISILTNSDAPWKITDAITRGDVEKWIESTSIWQSYAEQDHPKATIFYLNDYRILNEIKQDVLTALNASQSETAESEVARNPEDKTRLYTDFSKSELYDFYRFLERWEQKNKFVRDHKQGINKLRSINEILPNVEEMSILGRILGINQGLKTNPYDFRNFWNTLESFVNQQVNKFNDAQEKKSAKLSPFDAIKFALDEEYRQTWIQIYDHNLKQSFNILEVLTYVPHFAEMFKCIGYADTTMSTFSFMYRSVKQLINNLGQNPDQDTFKDITNYINEKLIANFILGCHISITLPVGQEYYPNLSTTSTVRWTPYPKTIENLWDFGTFKKVIEETLLPKLAKLYPDNNFVKMFIFAAEEDGSTYYKLPLQMMHIGDSPNTQLLYEEILRDFNSIADDTVPELQAFRVETDSEGNPRPVELTIGDLLYLYNMLINKDGFGDHSLTRLFETQGARPGLKTLVSLFNKWIGDLDYNGAVIGQDSHKEFRLRKSHTAESILVKHPDFCLNLPYTFNVAATSKGTPNYNDYKVKINSIECLRLVADAVNEQAQSEVIHIITDNDIDDSDTIQLADEGGAVFVVPNAHQKHAFIHNGELYINQDHYHFKTLMHEFAHLLFATLKFGDEEGKTKYYELLRMVHDDDHSAIYQDVIRDYTDPKTGALTVVGSDLDEEVVCRIIESAFAGEGHLDDIANSSTKQNTIVQYLMGSLGDFNSIFTKDLSKDILTQSIEYTPDSKAWMIKSQQVSSLKAKLYNSNDLQMDCK